MLYLIILKSIIFFFIYSTKSIDILKNEVLDLESKIENNLLLKYKQYFFEDNLKLDNVEFSIKYYEMRCHYNIPGDIRCISPGRYHETGPAKGDSRGKSA